MRTFACTVTLFSCATTVILPAATSLFGPPRPPPPFLPVEMSTYGTQTSGVGNASLTNVGYTALWVGFAV